MSYENHTPYLELPMCLRCIHAKITSIPCKNFSGDFGYNYPIACTNNSVTEFTGAYGEPSRSFWYDPNKHTMWADGGSYVNGYVKCGHFEPEYFTDETLAIMLAKNEIAKEVYGRLIEENNDD